MENFAVLFGAFAAGLAAAVIIRRLVKKDIPLSKDTYISSLGITLNERDKLLLALAAASVALCAAFLLISYIFKP